MKSYPVVFLGTPEFAAHHLQALIEDPEFDVKGVVSQPDRPSGRKLKLQPSAVKVLAEKNNLKVITPESMKASEAVQEVKDMGADAAVVVAYGQILTQEFLDAFPNKVVNVHGSLLPRWRGAAPIQRAIMAGDKETGVSLQVMVKKLDAGDVIAERKCEITATKDAMQLHDELKDLGAQILKEEFKKYLDGEVKPVAQNEELVTYAHKIEKSESEIDWTLSADEISQNVRGLQMGPGGAGQFRGQRLKVFEVESVDGKGEPGELIDVSDEHLLVACGTGALKIKKVQPESKARMSVSDFVHGYKVNKGDRFE